MDRTLKRMLRALVVLATSTLVVCGVKGPPRPPLEGAATAADGGPGPSPDGGPNPSADGGAK